MYVIFKNVNRVLLIKFAFAEIGSIRNIKNPFGYLASLSE